MPFCKNCGNKVPETSKSCSSCGLIINHVIQEKKTESSKFAEIQPVKEKVIAPDPSLCELNEYEDDDYSLVQHDDYTFDQHGMAIAELNGKWGIINRQGNWIVEPKFEFLCKFNEKDYFKAKIDGKYGYVNTKGDWIIQPIFDFIFQDDFDENGNIEGEINNQRILINKNPEYVLQSFFNRASSPRIYFKENIPNKELNSFCDNFNKDAISKWSFYVYYNDSLWGNGRHGFAIAKNEDELYCLLISSSQGTFTLDFNNGAIIFPLYQLKEWSKADIEKQDRESFIPLIKSWAFSPISHKIRKNECSLFTAFLLMNGYFDIFEILANIKMWKPALANQIMSGLYPNDINKVDYNDVDNSHSDTPLLRAIGIFNKISDRIFGIGVVLFLSMVLTVFLNCVTSYFFQDQLTKESQTLAQYAFRAFETYKIMLYDITGNFYRLENDVSKMNTYGQSLYYDYIAWKEGLKFSLIITFFISLPVCALMFRYTNNSMKKFFQSLFNRSSNSNIN